MWEKSGPPKIAGLACPCIYQLPLIKYNSLELDPRLQFVLQPTQSPALAVANILLVLQLACDRHFAETPPNEKS